MNPLDLRGPEFLLFYLLLGLTVTLLIRHVRRRAESEPTAGSGLLTDYLDIAYLRGGVNEALQVAMLTLVQRGLLEVVDGTRLRTRDRDAARYAQTATERQLLHVFTEPAAATTVLGDRSLKTVVSASCEPALIRLGLLPGPEARDRRRGLFLVALSLLGGVAAAKIVVAVSRGRTNILFLLLELGLFAVVTYKVTHPRRTSAGDTMVGDLQRLFGGPNSRVPAPAAGLSPATARAGGSTSTSTSSCSSSCGSSSSGGGSYRSNFSGTSSSGRVGGGPSVDPGLTMMAAVYGAAVLQETMPDSRRLFPQSSGDGGSTSDGSVSSSDSDSGDSGSSDSGGDSGGSSDGGGSGCGGCGGGGGD